MLDVSVMFDADRSRRPPVRAFVRELWALAVQRTVAPARGGLPQGAGRVVLVVPGFSAGDAFTWPLRRFLGQCGFCARGWGLGVNWGPTPGLLAGLERRVDALAARHGSVALVGISLGGLLARDLAQRRPGLISHVVTVASPFRLPTALQFEPLVRGCRGSMRPMWIWGGWGRRCRCRRR